MEGITEVLSGVIENAQKANSPVAGDYIGPDGLLYCGKCHTPKQTYIQGSFTDGRKLKVFAMCECAASEEREHRRIEQEQRRQEKIKRLRGICFAGTRERLASATFENDDGANTGIVEAAKRYVESFEKMLANGQGLLLFGDVGRGKSYIAACIANALIDKSIPVLMTSFSRIVSQLQKKFEERDSYFEWLNDFPLLIIDDFGAERTSEYMQEIVYTVIDNRYTAGRPMIITTNLNVEEIKVIKESDIYHKRVFGRINECCCGIEVKGDNRRESLARNNFRETRSLLGI